MSLLDNVDTLIRLFFEAEDKQISIKKEAIIDQVGNQLGKRIDGVRFGPFMFGRNGLRGKFSYFSVPPECEADVQKLINSIEKLHQDRQLIRQVLVLLLQACETIEDMRDALPEYFVNLSTTFRGMPRTRPEAYTIQNNPRSVRQYNKLLERIEFYSAMRLLY